MTSHGTSEPLRDTNGNPEVPCCISAVTDSFRITPTDYLRHSARQTISRLAVILIVPLLVCAVASVWDLRFAFIALILLFLVFPMVISYVYFTRLLTADARRAVWPKHLEFSERNKTVSVVYESADEENAAPSPDIFSANNIKGASISGKHLIFHLLGSELPLIIPLSSMPAAMDVYKLCSDYGITILNPQ